MNFQLLSLTSCCLKTPLSHLPASDGTIPGVISSPWKEEPAFHNILHWVPYPHDAEEAWHPMSSFVCVVMFSAESVVCKRAMTSCKNNADPVPVSCLCSQFPVLSMHYSLYATSYLPISASSEMSSLFLILKVSLVCFWLHCTHARSFALLFLAAGDKKEAENTGSYWWEAKGIWGPLCRDTINLEQSWSAVGTIGHKA